MIIGKKTLVLTVLTLFLMLSPFSIDAAGIKGFRNLRFGMTIEKAEKIYPDLSIVTEQNNFKVYKRSNENLTIGDISFDEVQYFFGNKGFTKVKAILLTWQLFRETYLSAKLSTQPAKELCICLPG